MTPAEAEARAAGIDAAIAAIAAHVTDTEQAMQRFPAVLKNYQANVAAIVPSLLATLRKLAAETREVEPGPFDGWTFKPWKDDLLWASKKGGVPCPVGAIGDGGWCAWSPNDGEPFAEGHETGDEGRKLTEDALIKAGATIPWRKGKSQ